MPAQFKGLSLGRLFMLGFRGEELAPEHWLHRALSKQHLGGVLLFDRNVDGSIQNISSPTQLKRLTTDLLDAACGKLLIAVDQEGGKVCRLKPQAGFPVQSGAAELACLGPDKARKEALFCAETLSQNGINLNFAPVVDLNTNPENPIISRYGRSYSANPEVVTEHARVFVAAHHQAGVMCCLKHFPGHGSASGDTHHGFVDASAQWQAQELDPYRRLIAEGYDDAIMSAHLVVQKLDKSALPATLSRPILTDLLRQELGFRGVICTDDMQMGAIRRIWPFKEAVQKAVLAGADLLVIGNNLQDQPEALDAGIEAIAELVDAGGIRVEKLAASISRIEALQGRACAQE